MNNFTETLTSDNAVISMKPVKKHVICLINFLTLVPLVYFIPMWIEPVLPDNKFIQVCAVVAIIVPIITYIAMPLVMKLLTRYLID